MENLADRRTEVTEKLAALRQEHGIAVLDGKEFDASSIAAAELEIDAIDAAEAEEERRQRAISERAFQGLRNGYRNKLRAAANKRLDAIKRADAACKELAAALRSLTQSSLDAGVAMKELGHRPPTTLFENEIKARAALRISVLMQPVLGPGSRYGTITFPHASGAGPFSDGTKRSDSWLDVEIMKTGAAIQAALKEEN